MQTTKIFGTVIGMDRIENYEAINKNLLEAVENDINTINIDTSTEYGFTTDTSDISEISDNLQNHEKFADLFKEITKSLGIFFGKQKYKDADFFITKCWSTYTLKEKYIATHEHVASHFSFTYYAQKTKHHSPLTFYAPKHRLYVPTCSEWHENNFESMSFDCDPGTLLVFPSYLFHGTEKLNLTDTPRVSISGDILLTAKPGVTTESLITHPSAWRQI